MRGMNPPFGKLVPDSFREGARGILAPRVAVPSPTFSKGCYRGLLRGGGFETRPKHVIALKIEY